MRWDQKHPRFATALSVSRAALAGTAPWLVLIGTVLATAVVLVGAWYPPTRPVAMVTAAALALGLVLLQRRASWTT
jgi:hypothetical protein